MIRLIWQLTASTLLFAQQEMKVNFSEQILNAQIKFPMPIGRYLIYNATKIK